jgi:hypothetical protein
MHIVAAGAGGFVGVSGAVGVTLISSTTEAIVEANAVIDGLHQGSAGANQSVYVNAGNNTNVQTFIIGIAGGFVGVSGAVDVGSINNNITAKVESGASVTATDNIEVNAVGLKSIHGFDVSGAGGFVGVGGAVSVWSIGTQIQKSTTDSKGNATKSATDDGKGGSADSNAGSQVQSSTQTMTGTGGGGLGNFNGSGNSNTSSSRVQSATSQASTKINSSTPSQSAINNAENSTPATPPGTSAIMDGSAHAGNAIGVHAKDQATITVIGGQVSGGVVGAGASVAILSVNDNV